MKTHNHIVRNFIIFLILLFPLSSLAVVKEVTLFPDSAKISETSKITPQCDQGKCTAVIKLPPPADPASLIVAVVQENRAKIDDMQIKPVAVQDEARIAELRKQISALEGESKEIKSKLQAFGAQLEFWQAQTKNKPKTILDSNKLADAIGQNVRKINQEKYTAEARLEKTEKDIKKLQEELNQAAGKKETAWEATLTLSGIDQKEISLSYTYLLAGCGWLPLYRLEALPGENKIAFSWEAEVWQSSGLDWKQVQLNLATLQPRITVEPPTIPDWIIRPRVLYKAARSQSVAAAPMMLEEAIMDDDGSGAAPSETRKTTYSVWSLGKRNIAAGERQRLKIKDEAWPAEFLFVARPAVSPQAFVRASVKMDEPAEIPNGQAVFVIDGAILGKRNFSLAGAEADIFFGTSPLVSVLSSKLAEKSGAKTFFQDKQTKIWQWQIEAINSSDTAIKLRIEEPAPQARDERIKLVLRQNPEPVEKDHAKFVWLLDVPAGQAKTIQNTVELEAPADMNLDFGWR
ncbi:MAG: mucoidy inhibitor MuiA family protein [Smithella sp.]|nr:mucoidy inhibitor MuiA family protein [Smithella sp.]